MEKINILLNELNQLKLGKYKSGQRDKWLPKAKKLLMQIALLADEMRSDKQKPLNIRFKIINGCYTIA